MVEKLPKTAQIQKGDNFRPTESFDQVRRYRGIPLIECGTEEELRGRRGFIIGDNDGCNFDVCFDNGIWNCHPNYDLVYFNKDGGIMYDF